MSVENLSSEDKRLQALFEREWEFGLENSPEFATFLGEHRHNDRLTDFSVENFNRLHEHEKEVLEELKGFKVNELSEVNRLNYELYVAKVENEIKEFEYKGYLMPLNQMYGVQSDFSRVILMMPFKKENDFKNYLSRLNAFPAYIDQIITLLETGLREGVTVPKAAIGSVPVQIQGQLPDDYTQSLYYKPLENNKNLPEALKEEIALGIQNKLYPAFQKLKNYLDDTYIPATRDSIGLSEIPDGKDYYNLKLKTYTTTEMTAEEIHDTGKKEVERIYGEILNLVKEIGFQGDYNDFLKYIHSSPEFYFTDAEQLLIHYRDIAKRADRELPRFFKVMPRLPYGVDPIPEHQAPSYPTAYYMPPDINMTRAGIFYANTSQLETRPKYEMEALTLHEAVPGHHLQIALALELDNLPKFRRLAMSGFTGYIEGWGLYSEKLGADMGFYTDPYARFGQLSFEIWRACRLVIDTGIHAFNWTRKQCIDYLQHYTGKSEPACAVEVDRYVSIPGQATAYKIGELKILELRKRYEDTKGDNADLREFHDIILRNGAIPLNILEDHFNEFLNK